MNEGPSQETNFYFIMEGKFPVSIDPGATEKPIFIIFKLNKTSMDAVEQNIWIQIRNKNTVVFEKYYKLHYRAFYLVACKYLRHGNEAEEVVNDVFMKIWEDGASIRIDVSLKSYIYKAIINRCLNIIQKSKRQTVLQTGYGQMNNEAYELRQIEENELKIKLFNAIDNLPEQCRKVFIMSRFDEMKQQDIASHLGISVKTVKNHITRALKDLNKIIEIYTMIFLLIKNFLTG